MYRSASGGECYQAVLSALRLGYRHIDTAQIYGNEADVGRWVARPHAGAGWDGSGVPAPGMLWCGCGMLPVTPRGSVEWGGSARKLQERSHLWARRAL